MTALHAVDGRFHGFDAALAGQLRNIVDEKLRQQNSVICNGELLGATPAAAPVSGHVSAAQTAARPKSHSSDVAELQSLLEAKEVQLKALRVRDEEGRDAIAELQAEVQRRSEEARSAELHAQRLHASAKDRSAENQAQRQALARTTQEKLSEDLAVLKAAVARGVGQLGERKLQLCMLEAGAATRMDTQDAAREAWRTRLQELQDASATLFSGNSEQHGQDVSNLIRQRVQRQRGEEQQCQLQLSNLSRRIAEEQTISTKLRASAEQSAAELVRSTSVLSEEEASARAAISRLEVELASHSSEMQQQRHDLEANQSLQAATELACSSENEEALALQAELRGGISRIEGVMAASEADAADQRCQLDAAREESAELQARLDRRDQRLRGLENERQQCAEYQAEIQSCEARLATLELIVAQAAACPPSQDAPKSKMAQVMDELGMAVKELGYEDAARLMPGLRGQTDLLLRASALDAAVRAVDGELAEMLGSQIGREHRSVRWLQEACGKQPLPYP